MIIVRITYNYFCFEYIKQHNFIQLLQYKYGVFNFWWGNALKNVYNFLNERLFSFTLKKISYLFEFKNVNFAYNTFYSLLCCTLLNASIESLFHEIILHLLYLHPEYSKFKKNSQKKNHLNGMLLGKETLSK